MKQRILYIDHAKAILITLVVFGHLLEQISFKDSRILYLCIYAFHMPAFIFISGLCYKKGAGIKKFVIYYLVFQTLYLLCDIYQKGTSVKITYTTPVWIMWYLLSMIFWYMISNYLQSDKINGLITLAISIALALVVGYDTTVGRYLTLSRTIVFFPFFWSGVYIKTNYMEKFDFFLQDWHKKNLYIKLSILSVALCCYVYLIQNQLQFKKYWFYEANAYNENGYQLQTRLILFILAAVLTVGFLIIIPKRKNKILEFIGKNTLPIYLWHGIVIKIATKYNIFKSVKYPFITACIGTIVFVGGFSMISLRRSVK